MIRKVSGRGDSHPPALAEPDVNLSTHPAPIAQPSGRAPRRQCANRRGDRLAIWASQAIARRSLLRNRWYFCRAQCTRWVEPAEEVEQPGLVEASVVVDPALHRAVEHAGKVVEGLVTAPTPRPRTDVGTHRLHRVR